MSLSLTNFQGFAPNGATGILVDAAGGSVKLEFRGRTSKWVPTKTYTQNTNEIIETGGFEFRLTAVGAATFELGSSVRSA
jgi:hypothetical protein